MTSTLNLNPIATTNAAGSFSISSSGFIQGAMLDDPVARYSLAAGYLDPAETLPMWGGVGISEYIPGGTNTPQQSYGPRIGRATSLVTTSSGGLTGFSVFNQAHAGLTTPQSPVPLYLSNMSVNFRRLGSGARLAVAADPALVSYDGSIIGTQFSWDFASQKLVKYAPAYVANPITGATWASTSGGRTTFTVTNDLSAVLVAGDTINVSGVVSTGGSGVGFNGEFIVVSVTSTQIVVTQALSASPGTYSSGGSVAAGGGALNVRVLEIQPDNNMTVNYDPVAGFATWNRNGAIAVILI